MYTNTNQASPYELDIVETTITIQKSKNLGTYFVCKSSIEFRSVGLIGYTHGLLISNMSHIDVSHLKLPTLSIRYLNYAWPFQ